MERTNSIYFEPVFIRTFYVLPQGSANVEVSLHRTEENEKIVLSFVVCDSRFEESLNVIKSVLLFTKTSVHFIIFTEEKLKPKFMDILNKWEVITSKQFDFELKSIQFPEAHRKDWMNLFSKCAAQRLFLPDLLPEIDAMIYVDTDTLFLGPIDDLWSYFSKFNTSQLTAMAIEDENPNVSWYPRFAKHPFYGKTGLNSGVMLMNLTRMREFEWVSYVTPIMMKWKLNIPWGDQDIINIIFHYHSRAVYELPCRYNYRTDQCTYGDACAGAVAEGVRLLHGSRQAFHGKEPAFQAMYQAVADHELGRDTPEELLNNMEKYFTNTVPTNCGRLKDAFFRVPVKTLTDLYSKPDR
ncbi:glucoside xylosyltransferase 1-like isoform X2 [Plodia interpunctella]|uniref:glucoside xylosyltransferase 1-like isoform X2 n=1 Tax=Plodia interpunctella TaxID=58824 RepID=UPI002368773C|nr:glucoside xylosyltransferase 1-like isoform X2 [Plodia interpunctella]